MHTTNHTTSPSPGISATRRRIPKPAKNAPMRAAVRRALHPEPADDERRGHVAEGREHVEAREHGEAEGQAEQRRQHQRPRPAVRRRRRAAPHPNDAPTRLPAAAAVSAARGSNATNTSPSSAIEIVTASQRYARNPMMMPVKMPRRSTPRTSPSTVPRAMSRIAARHDVATDAAGAGDGDATGQRDHVATDVSRDHRVAVHDDDTSVTRPLTVRSPSPTTT